MELLIIASGKVVEIDYTFAIRLIESGVAIKNNKAVGENPTAVTTPAVQEEKQPYKPKGNPNWKKK